MSVTPGTCRTSVYSASSKALNVVDYELNSLSDEELVKCVNDLKQHVKIIKLENEVLEKAITRLDPSLMHGVYTAYDYLIRIQTETSASESSLSKSNTSKYGILESLFRPSKVSTISKLSTFSKMFMNPTRVLTSISRTTARRDISGQVIGTSVIYGLGPRINLNEMLEIATIESNNVITNLNKTKDKAKRKEALLKAQTEEVIMRETDIEKAINKFNEDVLIESWDVITRRIPAEAWERFMADYLKATDKQIGKLRLRTSTLNTQYIKLKRVIQVKSDLKHSLTPVDFDKIKVDNAVCVKIIEQKIQHLGELKAMTGDANLMLNTHKKAMLNQNNYLVALKASKQGRDRLIANLAKEKKLIQIQVDILEKRLLKVKEIRKMYHVPNIMDYVQVVAGITDLKRNIKMLETRVAIKQNKVTSVKKGYST